MHRCDGSQGREGRAAPFLCLVGIRQSHADQAPRVIYEAYFATGSSSLFPHIVLHEAGLPFEPVKIDEHTKQISGGGNYRSVNPLGTVPALVLDDGALITEGAIIAQYIADLVPAIRSD